MNIVHPVNLCGKNVSSGQTVSAAFCKQNSILKQYRPHLFIINVYKQLTFLFFSWHVRIQYGFFFNCIFSRDHRDRGLPLHQMKTTPHLTTSYYIFAILNCPLYGCSFIFMTCDPTFCIYLFLSQINSTRNITQQIKHT